jgi:hypothetical protein
LNPGLQEGLFRQFRYQVPIRSGIVSTCFHDPPARIRRKRPERFQYPLHCRLISRLLPSLKDMHKNVFVGRDFSRHKRLYRTAGDAFENFEFGGKCHYWAR